jgi:hypothetical protein
MASSLRGLSALAKQASGGAPDKFPQEFFDALKGKTKIDVNADGSFIYKGVKMELQGDTIVTSGKMSCQAQRDLANELLALIAENLPQSVSGAVNSTDGNSVDLDKSTATLGGKTIHFPTKEAAITVSRSSDGKVWFPEDSLNDPKSPEAMLMNSLSYLGGKDAKTLREAIEKIHESPPAGGNAVAGNANVAKWPTDEMDRIVMRLEKRVSVGDVKKFLNGKANEKQIVGLQVNIQTALKESAAKEAVDKAREDAAKAGQAEPDADAIKKLEAEAIEQHKDEIEASAAREFTTLAKAISLSNGNEDAVRGLYHSMRGESGEGLNDDQLKAIFQKITTAEAHQDLINMINVQLPAKPAAPAPVAANQPAGGANPAGPGNNIQQQAAALVGSAHGETPETIAKFLAEKIIAGHSQEQIKEFVEETKNALNDGIKIKYNSTWGTYLGFQIATKALRDTAHALASWASTEIAKIAGKMAGAAADSVRGALSDGGGAEFKSQTEQAAKKQLAEEVKSKLDDAVNNLLAAQASATDSAKIENIAKNVVAKIKEEVGGNADAFREVIGEISSVCEHENIADKMLESFSANFDFGGAKKRATKEAYFSMKNDIARLLPNGDRKTLINGVLERARALRFPPAPQPAPAPRAAAGGANPAPATRTAASHHRHAGAAPLANPPQAAAAPVGQQPQAAAAAAAVQPRTYDDAAIQTAVDSAVNYYIGEWAKWNKDMFNNAIDAIRGYVNGAQYDKVWVKTQLIPAVTATLTGDVPG